MKSRVALTALVLVAGVAATQGQRRLNPVVELLGQRKPVFGVYAPRNPRAGRGGAPARSDAASREDAGASSRRTRSRTRSADYIFDGSMEGSFDDALPVFTEFMKGLAAAGTVDRSPSPRLHHPVIVKTHEIAPDPALAAQRIARQLDLGVSGIVFVGVESAEEVRAGLAAMRFKSTAVRVPTPSASRRASGA